MNTKLSILLAVLGLSLIGGGVAFALQPRSEAQTEVSMPVAEVSVEAEAPVEATEVEKEETAIEPEKAVPLLTPIAVPNVVNCDHNVPCFYNAVSAKKNAHFWGEGLRQLMPGVSMWHASTMDFRMSSDGKSYTFATETTGMKVVFGADWFDKLVASGVVPNAVQEQIAGALPLTEEELNTLTPEERGAYEAQVAAGKTPQEIARAAAVEMMQRYVESMIAGSVEVTRTCTSNDVSKLVAVLKNWEHDTYSTSDLDFAKCETSY
ncbi:MAG: hypothetical protein WC813_02355 [Patescibacteria group bacterium]|jgi:hypothetical protein